MVNGKVKRLSVIALLGFSVSAWSLPLGANDQQQQEGRDPKIETQQRQEAAAAPSSAVPQVLPSTPRPRSEEKEQRQQGENNASVSMNGDEEFVHMDGWKIKLTDLLLVLFNAVLAWATILLWRSTEKLWSAGEKQFGLSSDTAQRQLRAYVLIEDCKFDAVKDDKSGGHNWRASFQVRNVGHSAAFAVTTRGHIFVHAYPLTEIPKLDESNAIPIGVLFPGESAASGCVGDKHSPPFNWNSNALFILIEVGYMDAFGAQRFTRKLVHSLGTKLERLISYKDGNEAN